MQCIHAGAQGEADRGMEGEKERMLTVSFQSIMRRNSRSRTFNSATGIPPTLA